MDENDRKELGRRIAVARIRQYGTKSAAYKAADVNAATWDRAEQGLSIREDRLIAIVRTLWPDTGGDYRSVLAEDWAADAGSPKRAGEDIREWMEWATETFTKLNTQISQLTDAVEELRGEGGGAGGDEAAPKTEAGGSVTQLRRGSSATPVDERTSDGGRSLSHLYDEESAAEPERRDIPGEDEEPEVP